MPVLRREAATKQKPARLSEPPVTAARTNKSVCPYWAGFGGIRRDPIRQANSFSTTFPATSVRRKSELELAVEKHVFQFELALERHPPELHLELYVLVFEGDRIGTRKG